MLVWRCTRRSDQRNSVPSILIINLATADLLLGIQMLLYLFLIAWPCSVFSHETVVIVFCDVSAWLQMVSTMMSSVTTTTIAFYFVISLTCSSHCSRKCIVALLLSEWMLLSCVSCSLAIINASSIDPDFESIQCLPVSVTMLFYGGVIDFLLLIAVILYVVLLVKIKKQGNRPSASATVAQIQLIFIAFASFLCWGISMALSSLLRWPYGTYYDQYGVVAIHWYSRYCLSLSSNL